MQTDINRILSQEEQKLLQGFRQLDGYQQKQILRLARDLLEAETAQKDNPPAND